MNKKVNYSKKSSTDKKATTNSSKIKALVIIVTIAVLAILGYAKKWFGNWYNPNKKTTKTKLAKTYGISRRTLMIWIEKYCPEKIVIKYVSHPVQNIRIGDVYPHLGIPIPNVSTSKKTLATHCFMSKSSLQRTINQSLDFEETIGLTIQEYNQMKFVPPLFFERIIATYKINSNEI